MLYPIQTPMGLISPEHTLFKQGHKVSTPALPLAYFGESKKSRVKTAAFLALVALGGGFMIGKNFQQTRSEDRFYRRSLNHEAHWGHEKHPPFASQPVPHVDISLPIPTDVSREAHVFLSYRITDKKKLPEKLPADKIPDYVVELAFEKLANAIRGTRGSNLDSPADIERVKQLLTKGYYESVPKTDTRYVPSTYKKIYSLEKTLAAAGIELLKIHVSVGENREISE